MYLHIRNYVLSIPYNLRIIHVIYTKNLQGDLPTVCEIETYDNNVAHGAPDYCLIIPEIVVEAFP